MRFTRHFISSFSIYFKTFLVDAVFYMKFGICQHLCKTVSVTLCYMGEPSFCLGNPNKKSEANRVLLTVWFFSEIKKNVTNQRNSCRPKLMQYDVI